MLRAELLKKIRTFPLLAEKVSYSLLSGDFRSIFQGQGIEFDEVRLYQSGDDVRSIDRNVSARFGKPYIKLYREERDMVVVALLDCSRSMFAGGTGAASRFDQALLAAALIGFSAAKAHAPFGAIFFDKGIRHLFRPAPGHAAVMRIVSTALTLTPGSEGGSDLGGAIFTLLGLMKRHGFVVIISDFLSTGWEQEMGAMSRRYECLALRISDPIEESFPSVGLVPLEDPESRKMVNANTGSAAFHEVWAKWNAERAASWEAICRRNRAATLELSTAEDPAIKLPAFFSSFRRSR
jgi:uncharacterized protein (DUF58 family)